jgi:hypothetical protein
MSEAEKEKRDTPVLAGGARGNYTPAKIGGSGLRGFSNRFEYCEAK